MKINKKSIIIIILGLLFIASSVTASDDVRTLKTKVVDTLAKFPASNTPERDKYASELIQLGPAGILEICRMLTPPVTGDDTRVRFALNGLATYVNRTGAEKEREMYAKAVIKALESATNSEVKAFLIRQLQLAGKKESVKPLSRFLPNNRLCEPAVQALLAIRTPEAEKTLLKSIDYSTGAKKNTVIKSLGDLRSKRAAKKIMKYAASRDKNLRNVTLYALANIGDPSSEKVLNKVSVSASPYERAKAPSLYLLYAQRLAESGRKGQAARICRSLIKNYTAPHETNIPCSALSVLAANLGENVFEDLLACMESHNKELRWRALALASTVQGEKATARWIEKMADVPPETRAEIIAMLGRRKDESALPVILESLKSGEKAVRMAAIQAAARLGGDKVISDLFALMQTDKEDEIAVLKQTLMCLPGPQVVSKAAESLESYPLSARAALIEILSERHAKEHLDIVFAQTKSEDDTVRLVALSGLENLVSERDLPRLIDILLSVTDSSEIAATQNAVIASANLIPDQEKRAELLLAAMEKTEGKKRVDLLIPLSKIGGEHALQTIAAETKNEDPAIKNAAVFTLADWPELRAVDTLLNICRSTENKEHKLVSLKGYVRLVKKAELPPEEKLSMLKDALDIKTEAEAINIVLSGLADIKTMDSLKLAVSYMDNENSQSTAAWTAARIAMPKTGDETGLSGPEVISALKKSTSLIEDSYEQERIEKYIGTILEQEEFHPLFNGKDLSGWKGLVGDPVSRAKMTPEELNKAQAEADSLMNEHWKVVDGTLVFDGKGHSLCTSRDYTDFELLVDWKIEKHGDSGIYLRGSPQVQIWDPEQWPEGSGGLYNNKKNPSKPLKCVDNPIGEWNTFRIKMIGDRVTVHLNDVLVVNNVVMENYWERDKPIYPTGQIELQSHNSPLYFRNIFIREIIPEKYHTGLTENEITGGFEQLFNGKDLTGWTGDTDGYVAEEGKIVIYPKRSSGNLYTEEEYSDFILRFEFKLTPGANNGLGIRSPLTGDAAYVGIELQILDNTAHIYKDLKPYQYHGSIYGVVPAKRGHLKPVGEWNYEEVTARGRRITVNLNGVTIVDADIDQASISGTIDGRDHPGLKRDKGHIGFLGHGSRIEFRNIRIKELK